MWLKLSLMSSQRAFSFIELLVAVAIISSVVAGTSQYIGHVKDNKRKARLRDVQHKIASVIKSSITSPGDIYFSLSRYDKNPSLSSCLLGVKLPGSGVSGCSHALKKNRGKQTPFALYKVTNSSGTDGVALSHSEKSGDEVYYDITGEICENKNSSECAFEVETDFYVSCDRAKDPSCDFGITQAFFSYQVKKIPSAFAEFWQKDDHFPAIPKVKSYTAMTAVQILGPNRFSECGSGRAKLNDFKANEFDRFSKDFTEGFYATLIGYDSHGKPKCACAYPFIRVGEEQDPKSGVLVPVCRLLKQEELSCNKSKGEYLRGIASKTVTGDKRGNKELICVQQDQAFECGVMSPLESCPVNSWITQMTRNDCEFLCEYKANQVRTCTFFWGHNSGPSVPKISDQDNGSFGSFTCMNRQTYCCQPSHFRLENGSI